MYSITLSLGSVGIQCIPTLPRGGHTLYNVQNVYQTSSTSKRFSKGEAREKSDTEENMRSLLPVFLGTSPTGSKGAGG